MTAEAQYQVAVDEARVLVKRSKEDQWRLAQLTWEQVQAHVTRAQWAQDVGLHPTYVGRLYSLWNKWRTYTESSRPDFNEAYLEISPYSAHQPQLRNQSVTDQAKAVQEALSNPEVAKKVFSDPDTKTSAITAIHHANTQPPKPSAEQPPSPSFTKLDVLVLLGEAKDTFRRAFKLGVTLELAGDEEVLSDLGDALDEGEQFHQYLLGMGLDEAIEKIMEGA